jgi:hypothetical protein
MPDQGSGINRSIIKALVDFLSGAQPNGPVRDGGFYLFSRRAISPILYVVHLRISHFLNFISVSLLFAQVTIPCRPFNHYQEYLPGPGVSVNERVEAWKEITKSYNVIKRVGGSPTEDETREAYNAHGWVITAPKIKHVEPQIDKVVALKQLNKIFVFRDLVHYLDENRTFARKLDESGQITQDIENEARFHLMACERYGMSDFTPETVVRPAGRKSYGA